MEEKELIVGKFSNYSIVTILGGVIAAICLIFFVIWGLDGPDDTDIIWFGVVIAATIFIVGVLIGSLLIPELIVTNKRVYGKDSIGKRVDLPIDMISSVATSAFSGIGVATASGRISFNFCQNKDDVFDVISKLLLDRQDKARTMRVETSDPLDIVKELKMFKELLDDGVITAEEFEAKKKKLLKL